MKSLRNLFALFLLLALLVPVFAQPTATPEANQERTNELIELMKGLDPVQQEMLLKIAKKLDEDESGKFLKDAHLLLRLSQEPAITIGEDAPVPSTAPAAPSIPDYKKKSQEMKRTAIVFDHEEYNFGEVRDGEKVKHVFTFRNDGPEPFVLQRAKASCGCTVPSYTKSTIMPGEEGTINVEFNTKNKVGLQTKTITVTGNFEGNINKVLRIKGEVLPSQE